MIYMVACIQKTMAYCEATACVQVQNTGDVIAFYNSVFVPAVKTDLLRINHERSTLAKPPATEGLLGASPARAFSR